MGVFFVLTHGVEEKGRLSGFGRRCRGTGEREEGEVGERGSEGGVEEMGRRRDVSLEYTNGGMSCT